MNRKLFFILIVFSGLFAVLYKQKEIQQLLGFAASKPANIMIESKNSLGPINTSWAAFSQGGEEAPIVFAPVIPKMKELAPKLIRIDHIYDFNKVVAKNGDKFTYDFSALDKVVDDIIAMGAIPFFSLSYMPAQFTSDGSVISPPMDWNNWKDLVRATVEHFSGKKNRNLSDVYYEVWNEPELPQFGGWKLDNSKDYRLLYYYAAQGADQATEVNNYYFGGPGVGSYYPSWVSDFASYAAQNNLRLDFYSWHRYTRKPYEYAADAQKIKNLLSVFPKFSQIDLILTEWGIDSENSMLNNSNTAASYAVYSVSQFNQLVKYAFNFEVKDGPPETGGKWGLLTHERDIDKPISPKPKFKAFSALAKMKGDQLLLNGCGTYVCGISTKTGDKISILLANYDYSGKNIENTPVTLVGLDPSIYNIKYTYVLDDRSGFYEVPSTNGSINKSFLLPSNSILHLEVSKAGKLATFVSGLSVNPSDKSLIINNIDGPLTFNYPEFNLLPVGLISFHLKPFWDTQDNRSFYILEVPFEMTKGVIDKLSLSKQKTSGGNILVFSVSQSNEEKSISYPIDKWAMNVWHKIEMGWDQNEISVSVDGIKTAKKVALDIRNGKTITFSPIEAALDNIEVFAGKEKIIDRQFDGRVDK